mmetsp:Transcript_5282/g.12694  ORF Transcript_5282/g.12694 Transcript_5282/m.12694 type:complete len:236 (+) Transcript_5282:618-1325(+)
MPAENRAALGARGHGRRRLVAVRHRVREAVPEHRRVALDRDAVERRLAHRAVPEHGADRRLRRDRSLQGWCERLGVWPAYRRVGPRCAPEHPAGLRRHRVLAAVSRLSGTGPGAAAAMEAIVVHVPLVRHQVAQRPERGGVAVAVGEERDRARLQVLVFHSRKREEDDSNAEKRLDELAEQHVVRVRMALRPSLDAGHDVEPHGLGEDDVARLELTPHANHPEVVQECQELLFRD